MWWLLALLPVALLPFVNCSSDNRDEVRKKAKSNLGKSALKKPRDISQINSHRRHKKKVSFKEGKAPAILSASSSTRGSAAIWADEQAAALATVIPSTAATVSPIPADNVSQNTLPVAAVETAAEVRLKSEPEEVLCYQTGSLQAFNLINPHQEPSAFKVKCSDKQLYRVKPVFGVVEAKGMTRVEVLRANGSSKRDHLVIVAAKMTKDDAKQSVDLAQPGEKSHIVVPLLVEAC